MSEVINTHYQRAGFSTADDIVLNETPRTRTVFRPAVHQGGVRGYLIRQKVGADGKWADVNDVNFTTLAPDCGVKIELDTTATGRLREKLEQLHKLHEQGAPREDQSYVVAKQDQVLIIDDQTKHRAIQQLLQKGYTEDFWRALMRDKPDLAAQLAAAKIQFDREQAIKAFGASLTQYADNENYWQKFFEKHPWMLQSAFSAPVFMLSGDTYVGGKIAAGRQGTGGVATDFLFADDSTKSFAVVEIKTPDAKLVGIQYRGRRDTGHDNEVYAAHSDLSGAIVQVRNQITVAVEDFQSVLGRSFEQEINRVHPKGVLVLGTTSGMTQRQKDSFNQFRQALHSLTVITFDELLNRLQLLFTEEGGRRNVNVNQQDRHASPDGPWGDEPPF
jgi:hypothetical protein